MDTVASEWEAKRLAALHDLEILDTPPEPEFDEIVELAADICEAPIAIVSLVDKDRQWFKAIVGLDATETPREHAFCAHTILGTETMVVPDATKDSRFADNPLVTGDPNIRLYAGVPVRSPDNYPVGTLCLIDDRPRELTDKQLRRLEILAGQIEQLLTLHQQNLAANRRESLLRSALEESIQAKHIVRALLDNSRNLIGVLSVDGVIRDANRTALAMSGARPGEVIGVPFWDTPWWAHSEQEQAKLKEAIERAATGEVAGFIATHPKPEGGLAEIDFRIVPIKSSSGDVVYLVPEGIDITEHTRLQREVLAAKNAAEESENRFRNIADSATVLIFTTNIDGNITWANQPLVAYAGGSLQELQRIKWPELIHPDDAEQAKQHAAIDGPGDYGFECRVPRYDDENFWHLLKLAPRWTNSREQVGYVGVLVDVDANRVARVALEASQASLTKALTNLQQVRTELEQMARALSHEIMPPIVSLERLTQRAESTVGRQLPSHSSELFLNLRQHTEIVRSMLEHLLSFYSVGREPEGVEEVEVEKLVREIWEELEPAAMFSLSTGELPIVMTQRTSLATVFRNLLTNAVQHSSGSAANISIQCDKVGTRLQFRVSDQGRGIALEDHERIFELFDAKGGTAKAGVGLAVVRKLVELHGGRIHVESFGNKGSTFIFTWPACTQLGAMEHTACLTH